MRSDLNLPARRAQPVANPDCYKTLLAELATLTHKLTQPTPMQAHALKLARDAPILT